jgi:hypothetical protein
MFAYPRNPHGCGYMIEASAAAVAATQLPNLEDPLQLLNSANLVRVDPDYWPLAPRPTSAAWLPYVHFPRSAQTGLPVASFSREHVPLNAFPEVGEGLLRVEALMSGTPTAQRINVACAQASAPNLRFPEVVPGSVIEIRNVHPAQPIWRWQLPLEWPRMAYRVPKQTTVELGAKIRTLFVQPDKDLVCVVWVGEHSVDQPVTIAQLQRADFGMRWTS